MQPLLTNFKLAWKAFSGLVSDKVCFDLTLLHIDYKHHFLQHHTAIFVAVTSRKTDRLGHLPTQFCKYFLI